MTKTFKVTMQYPDGNTMFPGTITAEEIIEIPAKGKPSPNGTPPGDSVERMTDPQKRYLFRLLAAQGTTGKAAEEHLKTYFGVQRIFDIPKQAASSYIDQLAKDRRDAQGA